jgi:long-chain fatty acid transport protein
VPTNQTINYMRKLILLGSAVLLTGSVYAGGIVTNTNQSASWVRMPARDASTGIEATYFNPAGLMKLKNGLHFSLSNQMISQKREVENFYTGPGGLFGLNESLYKGSVSAPLFPSAYAVYKMDKLAFSFGFNPVGGGGGATFEKGLPSFEMSPSDLVPSLAGQGVNAYRINTFFEGSSIYFGYQAGVSYKINEMISVFAGLRYVTAKNSNQGYLRDIEVYNFGGNPAWVRADVIMGGIAGNAGNAKTVTSNIILANAAYGELTFAQAEGFGIIDGTQRAQLEGALTAFGGNSAMKISDANTTFAQAEGRYNATATLLADQEADVEQTGTGITPIFGVNISLNKLNIGIKYEMATKLELENKTTKDVLVGFTQPTGTPITMFPDGAKFRNDMPAMLSIGASYEVTSKLGAHLGGHYYFDKNANYGKKIAGAYVENTEVIDNNFIEIAAGLEYSLSQKFLVSGGYLITRTGVNEMYQSDISNSQSTGTIGLGGKYSINEKIGINLGVGYTTYDKAEKTFNHVMTGNPSPIPVKETYWKNTMFIGVGLDISL